MYFTSTMISRFFLGFFFLLTFNLFAQDIDSDESTISFEVGKVQGSLDGLQGDIVFSKEALNEASFNVCLNAGSIDTDNTKRDDHLKTDDFFDIAAFTTICYQSTEIIKTNSGYESIGNLTLRGISKPVTIPFTYKDGIFEGSFEIKRLDYGIGPKSGLLVSKEVKVAIKCVTH